MNKAIKRHNIFVVNEEEIKKAPYHARKISAQT